MNSPITSCPCCFSSQAEAELSTPPLMAENDTHDRHPEDRKTTKASYQVAIDRHGGEVLQGSGDGQRAQPGTRMTGNNGAVLPTSHSPIALSIDRSLPRLPTLVLSRRWIPAPPSGCQDDKPLRLERGRLFYVPRSRRLTCDVLHFHKQVPLCPHHRMMDLGSLEPIRKACQTRISWPVLFLKAYSLMAREIRSFARAGCGSLVQHLSA